MPGDTREHWDGVYERNAASAVSWYEPRPLGSLALIARTGIALDAPIIDVGSGASLLIDELLAAGYRDLTVLDLSARVLDKLRERLGSQAALVRMLNQDVTAFRPARRYSLWHDRAVFHFLTAQGEREGYLEALRSGLEHGGHLIMATFGPAGPERCSGLATVRYDAAALCAVLGPQFTLVESSLALHSTPSGAQQQFLYCRFVRTALARAL